MIQEDRTDNTVVEESVEKNVAAVPEKLVLLEVAKTSTVEESPKPLSLAASTPTANVKIQAAMLTENTHIQSSSSEFRHSESTAAIDSLTTEVIGEELGDRNENSIDNALNNAIVRRYQAMNPHDTLLNLSIEEMKDVIFKKSSLLFHAPFIGIVERETFSSQGDSSLEEK
ncbi:MAG: hypothetical protein CLLPBCKN_006881 [Chroococcidiopsis cubana SAG 39.79]|nr:hypothetical protein [Chroococcidiopsis cubana SAG 39.79]PSB65830.1 hypothetical protein C7B79_03695 [Chroococcidiopsis cubana CCALA 043]